MGQGIVLTLFRPVNSLLCDGPLTFLIRQYGHLVLIISSHFAEKNAGFDCWSIVFKASRLNFDCDASSAWHIVPANSAHKSNETGKPHLNSSDAY